MVQAQEMVSQPLALARLVSVLLFAAAVSATTPDGVHVAERLGGTSEGAGWSRLVNDAEAVVPEASLAERLYPDYPAVAREPAELLSKLTTVSFSDEHIEGANRGQCAASQRRKMTRGISTAAPLVAKALDAVQKGSTGQHEIWRKWFGPQTSSEPDWHALTRMIRAHRMMQARTKWSPHCCPGRPRARWL